MAKSQELVVIHAASLRPSLELGHLDFFVIIFGVQPFDVVNNLLLNKLVEYAILDFGDRVECLVGIEHQVGCLLVDLVFREVVF